MKLFWQQNKILIIFFIFMTAFSVASFFDSANEEKTKPLAEIIAEPHNQMSLDEKNLARSPASAEVKTVVQQQIKDEKQANQKNKLALVIFCDGKNLHLNSSSHLLLLELTSCSNLKEKNQLWIKNETNGFKAQIFTISSKKFKTDFIQLNHGLNKISLQGILKDGQKVEQTLEILSGF